MGWAVDRKDVDAKLILNPVGMASHYIWSERGGMSAYFNAADQRSNSILWKG